MVHACPAAAVSGDDIEAAKRERVALQVQLDKTVYAYEAAEGRLEETRVLIAASKVSLAESQGRMEAAQARIGTRANLTYREGLTSIFEFLFTAQTLGDFSRRLKLVGDVSKDDASFLREIEKARTQSEKTRQELDRRAREERETVRELSAMTGSLESRFSKAAVLEKKLVANRQAQVLAETRRKAREAAAAGKAAKAAAAGSGTPAAKLPTYAVVFKPPAASSEESSSTRTAGGLRCPVNGPTSFTDTYGHPREGGRRHEGVDMFAAQGTPVVATTGAVVHRQGSSGAGGISVLLRGQSGTDYYYAHLSKIASISVGQKVTAGATIGYVGSTGNASAAAPHLHFEVRPDGGGPINPYPTAKAACG